MGATGRGTGCPVSSTPRRRRLALKAPRTAFAERLVITHCAASFSTSLGRNVWPAPFTGRCLRNAHADRWFGREIELMRHLDEESAKYAAARDAGDFDIAAVIAGEAAGLIHDIPSARDVIERVVHEASALLTQYLPG